MGQTNRNYNNRLDNITGTFTDRSQYSQNQLLTRRTSTEKQTLKVYIEHIITKVQVTLMNIDTNEGTRGVVRTHDDYHR